MRIKFFVFLSICFIFSCKTSHRDKPDDHHGQNASKLRFTAATANLQGHVAGQDVHKQKGIAEAFLKHSIDVIGFQEGGDHDVMDKISALLASYELVKGPGGIGLFIRKSSFELVGTKSEHTYRAQLEVGEIRGGKRVGWGARSFLCQRIKRDLHEIEACVTHLDVDGIGAKEGDPTQIQELADYLRGKRFVAMGDFNASLGAFVTPSFDQIDAVKIAGFPTKGAPLGEADIDGVYVSSHFKPLSNKGESFGGGSLSDHMFFYGEAALEH